MFRKPKRQEVTGIVVNEQLNLSRAVLRRFRAALFQIEKDGPDGKHWGSSVDIIAAVKGFANYAAMVNPQKGAPLQARARKLVKRYGKKVYPKPVRAKSNELDKTPAASSGRKKSWWKIW